MHIVITLLLLVSLPPSLAAPIPRRSSSLRIFGPRPASLDTANVCHRHRRHHGHLTFRLARLDSCSAVSDQYVGIDDANDYQERLGPELNFINSRSVTSRDWAG